MTNFTYFLLPKFANLTILTSILYIKNNSNNKLLLLFSVLFGLLIQVVISTLFGYILTEKVTTIVQRQKIFYFMSIQQLTCSFMLIILTGFHIIHKRGRKSRLSLFLIPFCYVLNQGIDVNLYLMQKVI
ncbi:MAG: hypothetical protein EXX96DRAFT_317544 [Benjaminiella poitrasii]|nr:MAG: hypothetical protein EXX96DRAFT_317544 [Benjaminiella poitrasii]